MTDENAVLNVTCLGLGRLKLLFFMKTNEVETHCRYFRYFGRTRSELDSIGRQSKSVSVERFLKRD